MKRNALLRNTLLVTAPESEKANLPNQNTVENWLVQVEAEALLPYKDEMSKLPLLSHEPVASKIFKEEEDEVLHMATLTLSNSVRVVLKLTDFQNNQVLLSGFAPGGSSLYSDANFQSAKYAAGIASISGLGNYSASKLRKHLSSKQAGAGVGISEDYQTASGGCATSDLKTMLQD
jgi:zinc protease